MYPVKDILNSKLRYSGTLNYVKRSRLSPLIDQIPQKRLTMIMAPAGFGKTTFAYQAISQLKLKTVWYHLDQYDSDYTKFVNYLITGLSGKLPKIKTETIPKIELAFQLGRDVKELLTILLIDLEKYAKPDILIILDDYHLVAKTKELNESVQYFVERIPPTVHVVMVSRTIPPLKMSKFQVKGELLQIREKDLAFTASEIKQLYADIFNLRIEDKNHLALKQKTGGWVAGLILFSQIFENKTPQEIETLLSQITGSHFVITKYLEENVFDLQEKEAQDFLLKTSILSRMEIEFCTKFLEKKNTRQILETLEGKNLFVFSLDEERKVFAYHPLFQEFLQAKLHQEYEKSSIKKLHHLAGMVWEDYGKDDEALSHYLAGGIAHEASRLIGITMTKLTMIGRLESIQPYLDNLPRGYIDQDPSTQYLKGISLDFSGNPKDALHYFEKAYYFYQRSNSDEGCIWCIRAMAYQYLKVGDLQRGETTLKKLLPDIEDKPDLYFEMLILLSQFQIYLGKVTEADQHIDKAILFAKAVQDSEWSDFLWSYLNHIKGMRYIYSGDLHQSIDFLKKTDELSLKFELYILNMLNHAGFSFGFFQLGDFAQGTAYARQGLAAINKMAYHDYVIHAFLLLNYGLNTYKLGNKAEGIDACESALKIFQKAGSSWGQAESYIYLYWVYTSSGNNLKAKKCIQLCKEVSKDYTNPCVEGMFDCVMANELMKGKKLKEALPFLKNAEKKLSLIPFEFTKLAFLYGQFFWLQGKDELAKKTLIKGLTICEAKNYDIFNIIDHLWQQFPSNETDWISSLLVEIFLKDTMKHQFEHTFRQVDSLLKRRILEPTHVAHHTLNKNAVKKNVNVSVTSSEGLRIFCFGKFRLFRGNTKIPIRQWKSKKALSALKYLVVTEHVGYQPKDILMELLWPEQDVSKTSSRLRVLFYEIRKTLEPDLKKGAKSSYLLNRHGSIMLNMGDGGWSDIQEFNRELKIAEAKEATGKESITHYINAESLYAGDLFTEDLYAQWCQNERDMYQNKYIKILSKIIGYHEEHKNIDQCIEYATKYIDVNKYDEQMYQTLMFSYAQLNNRPMIIQTFEKCYDHIVNELECPLRKSTENLYKQLTS